MNLWTVILGTIHLRSGSELSTKTIIIHENYTIGQYENDIALVELSSSLSFTRYIRPVCLPETVTTIADNSSCYVSGWGALSEGG